MRERKGQLPAASFCGEHQLYSLIIFLQERGEKKGRRGGRGEEV